MKNIFKIIIISLLTTILTTNIICLGVNATKLNINHTNITREDFCEIIMEIYASRKSGKLDIPNVSRFIDTNNKTIDQATELGIIKGINSKEFAPYQNITREQVAVIFIRLLNSLEIYPINNAIHRRFDDEAKISKWAVDDVKLVNKLGILNTLEKNKIEPKGTFTRVEAETFANSMMNKTTFEKMISEITQTPIDPRDKKLSKSFNKFNNDIKSWWFRRAKDHQPNPLGKDIVDVLHKYEGLYLHYTDKKVLYLTFDAGYENGYTPKILDALKENNVPATFFITGHYIKKHSELVQRMLEEGHIIGNHTVNHPSMPSIKDEKKLTEEILGLERLFFDKFQMNMHYLRPPEGKYSERTLALAKDLGYRTVFWSFAYMDWDVKNQKGADYAYDRVMKELHNGAIILLHNISKDNAEALDRIIKDARALGYEFKSLDDID